MRRTLALIFCLAILQALTGCAQVMSNLRRDLNDEPAAGPTTGGIYPDGGYLDEETAGRYRVGHSDRSPASVRGEREGQSWVARMDRYELDRDRERFRAPAEEHDQDSAREEAPQPRRTKRVTREDFVDRETDSGSLWASDGQTNFFFSKNRARSSGDIITINVETDLLRDMAAEVKRTLTADERDAELERLQPRVAGSAKGDEKPAEKTAEKASGKPEDFNAEKALAELDLSSALGIKAGDAVLAEITERYANGNYRFRGTKRIPFRGGVKLMAVSGIVRGADLSDDEKVGSGKIYEYRLEVAR